MKKLLGYSLMMLLLFGCGKRILIELDEAFVYQIDSCCVDIPNIFTPNDDGINDVLFCHALYTAEFHLRINNSSNQLVFSCDTTNQYWDGKQNTENGRVVIKGKYLYHLNARSISGEVITASRYITIIQNTNTHCITHTPSALFGDMIDPRYCGPVYETMETICYKD